MSPQRLRAITPWPSALTDEPLVKSWRPETVADFKRHADSTELVARAELGPQRVPRAASKRAPGTAVHVTNFTRVMVMVHPSAPSLANPRLRVATTTRLDSKEPAPPEPPAVPSQSGAPTSVGLVTAVFFAGALLTLLLVAPMALLQVYVAIPVVLLGGVVVVCYACKTEHTTPA